jgi:two-component system, OmpR family, response regulator QseB
LRVLIVEDDLSSSNALCALLSRRGYDVAQATTLAEAMRDVNTPFDAIILDLMLPDGDGGGVLRHVRSQNLPTKVLVTTGISDAARAGDVQRMKPDRFLKKPIDLAELLSGLSGE